MQEAGALEAAAVAIEADDDGAEAADQNCGPVHPELLGHRLPAWRTVAVNKTNGTGHSRDGLFLRVDKDSKWKWDMSLGFLCVWVCVCLLINNGKFVIYILISLFI